MGTPYQCGSNCRANTTEKVNVKGVLKSAKHNDAVCVRETQGIFNCNGSSPKQTMEILMTLVHFGVSY